MGSEQSTPSALLRSLLRKRLEEGRADETLKAGWEAFENELPSDLVDFHTLRLMRRAFFSGALAAYILTLIAVAPEDEEECGARLQKLGEEVSAAIQELEL